METANDYSLHGSRSASDRKRFCLFVVNELMFLVVVFHLPSPSGERCSQRGKQCARCKLHPHSPWVACEILRSPESHERDRSQDSRQFHRPFFQQATHLNSIPICPLSPASTQPFSPSNRTGQEPSGIHPFSRKISSVPFS